METVVSLDVERVTTGDETLDGSESAGVEE